TDQTDDLPVDGNGKPHTGLIDFRAYDEQQENLVLYHCKASSARQVPVPDNAKTGTRACWELTTPRMFPKDAEGRNTSVITADIAILSQIERTIREERYNSFVADLRNNVRIEGEQKNNLLLTGEGLSYDDALKSAESDVGVRVSDRHERQMILSGNGMKGMVNFKTLTFHRDITAYFAGSQFSVGSRRAPESGTETGDGKEQRITKITCSGPMTLRRFDDIPVLYGFLETFDKFRATFGSPPLEEKYAADCLRFFQRRFAESFIAADDRELAEADIRQFFAQSLPEAGRASPADEQVSLLLDALQKLGALSGDVEIEDVQLLRKMTAMLDGGELNVDRNGNGVSLLIITFRNDVVAATRQTESKSLTEIEAEDSARLIFREPFIDSWQKCDRLTILLKQWSKTGPDGKNVLQDPEPEKIEMAGYDQPVLMKSFSPVPEGSNIMQLDSIRECRQAHIYLEPDSQKKDSPPKQSRIVLIGDVLVQQFRLPDTKDGEATSAVSKHLYEASGAVLIWDRKTGQAELLGRAEPQRRDELPVWAGVENLREQPPQIGYSSLTAGARSSQGEDHAAVVGRCSDRIEMDDVDETRSRVTLYEDVKLDMSRAGAAAGDPLETLQARNWVELTFDKRRENRGGRETVFGGVESLEAAGEARTCGEKGQTWSDMLTYRVDRFADRPAKILILHRLTPANRDALLRGRISPQGRDWPLRAVMQSDSPPGFLDTDREEKTREENVPGTYTADCNDKITYIEFDDDAASPAEAAVVIFDKDVTLEKQSAGSRDISTLRAKDRVTLRFVAKEPRRKEGSSLMLELVSLRADGRAFVSEPRTGTDTTRIQQAEGDIITWRRPPPAGPGSASNGAAVPEKTVIAGNGFTAPRLRTVTDKPKESKTPIPSGNLRVTEETILHCTKDGGVITIYQSAGAGSPEKLTAEKDAHTRQTRAVHGPGGRKPAEEVLHMGAGTLKVFMVPDERSKSGVTLKRIEAYDNVLISSRAFTAHSHKAVWERLYEADVIENTYLYATPRGNPRVEMRRRDSNGRSGRTVMTCTQELHLKKVVYDEEVNPKYSSETTAYLTENVNVDHYGFADRKNRALHEDTHLTCDVLEIDFEKNPRTGQSGNSGIGGEIYRIEKMIAKGDAKYMVHGTLEEEHRYPDQRVMLRDGEGGYIEYRTPGTSKVIGRMYGTKDSRGKYIKDARRTEYLYDSQTRRLLKPIEEKGTTLAPMVEQPE
ncbi:MAG: hypothetical protein ABIH04_10770, partial [Planctomycetota bacterium]